MLEDTLRSIYNLPTRSTATPIPMMEMGGMVPITMQEGGDPMMEMMGGESMTEEPMTEEEM